ncbi:MAG: N-acetyltransferase [Pirellulales bacterium]|jgi:phosphinothricin acetyltransferase|nr:N-acetyltransferase [Pirellulales bacterium]|tara:strand:- start:1900 stop:2448 length:549 start_codon:yes stop_codon:yes gene_type:complete
MHRKKPTPPIRPILQCSASQLPAIQKIFNDAILHSTALYEYVPRDEKIMQAWLSSKQNNNIPVIGIEWEPGVLAGFATWGEFRPRAAYKYAVEHSVYVDEQFRGEGIGRQLLEALIDAAKQHERHSLIAGIDATNVASVALHSSLGFHCCGTVREAGFKFGKWLDLEFWQLLLPTPANPKDG